MQCDVMRLQRQFNNVIWLQHFLAKIDKHFGGRVGKNQHRSCNVFGDACVSLCGYYFNRFGYLSFL
jgi:hypothetical protein